MKRKKIWIYGIIFLWLCSLFCPVLAVNETGTENEIMPRTIQEEGIVPYNEETSEYAVNSDVYYLNEDVVVDMPINGNVFIMGSTVTISSIIEGNVFVMGGEVTIDSNAIIYGSIFSLANTLHMQGQAYDIYVAGNKIEVAENASLYRDVKAFCENLSIAGTVSRDVFATANTLQIADTASIGKDVSYAADTEATVPEGVVAGEIMYHPIQKAENTRTVASYISSILSQAVFVFAVYLVCLGIAPKFSKKAGTILKERWGASLGLGVAGLVAIPIVAFLLLTTGIATNLSVYTFTAYGLLLASGFTVVCIAINQLIAEKWNFSKVWMSILSLIGIAILLGIVKLIPIVSWVITILGVGIFLVSLFQQEGKQEAK